MLRRVGDLHQQLLNDWEDLTKAEDSIRLEYSGRFLFELLQNANDAILDQLSEDFSNRKTKDPSRVCICVSESLLIVANDGLPFLEDNILAICRLHKTTKSISKRIGHKGIGFKSVLEITDTPEV